MGDSHMCGCRRRGSREVEDGQGGGEMVSGAGEGLLRHTWWKTMARREGREVQVA